MAEPYELTDADRHEWDRWDAWNNLQGSVTRDVYGGPVGLGNEGKDFKWNPDSSLSDFSSYWNYDKAAGPRSTSDLSGVGWLPTNQEVARSQYLTPDGSNWEYTKFVRAPWHSGEDIRTGADHRGLHKWDFEFNQPQTYGWDPDKHVTTGKARSYTDQWHDDPDDPGDWSSNYKNWAVELLDFDAYSKDFQYQEALRGMRGLNDTTETLQFRNFKEIQDARDIITGKVDPNQKQRDAELAKTNQQIELLQQQLDEARAPRLIDVGGTEVSEGGVGDYIAELQAGWDQQAASNLDYFTNQFTQQQTDYSNQLSGLQDAWGVQSAQELQDLETSLRGGFQTDLAAKDALYSSQIQDLTSSWGTERDQLSGQIGSLGDQISANQSAYDTSLSNLNTRISEYKADQKASQEAQALEAQRLRTAASYGSSGRPVNQTVQGVKTLNELPKPRRGWGGTSGAFGRKGLRITNLNI